MVQIVAPESPPPIHGESPPSWGVSSDKERLAIGPESAVDSGAITQSAIAGIELGDGERAPRTHDSRTHDSRPPASKPPTQTSHLPPQPETYSTSPNSTVTEAADYRNELSSGQWQNATTHRTKQIVLVTLLSFFGLITIAVVFSQFLRTWQNQQISAERSTIEPDKNPTQPLTPEQPLTPVTDDAATPDLINGPKEGIEAENDIEKAAIQNVEGQPSTVDDEAPTRSPSTPPLNADPVEMNQGTNEVKKDVANVTADTISVAVNGDPVKEDPQPLDDDSPPTMNSLPPGLLKYTPLLNTATTDNQTAPVIPPPPTIDTVRLEEATEESAPEEGADAPRKPIDVQKALGQRFAIDNQGESLANILLVVSQITALPIEVELISLDAANIRVDEPVKTPSGWMSAEQWLDSLCATHGLVVQRYDGRLMVSAKEDRVDAGLAPALNLDDLGNDGPNLFSLLKPLMLDEEAEAMEVDGELVQPVPSRLSDDGTMIIPGPSLRSKVRAALAVEALRMIRKIPTKLERWRTTRWMGPWVNGGEGSVETELGDWQTVQKGEGGPRLDSPRATAGLLRSIATLNRVSLLVGWYDSTRHGLYPADPVMPFSNEATAEAMLEEILGEAGLQTRICGPKIWYVGSAAAYDRFEVMTWMQIPEGSGQMLRKRLANSLSISDDSRLPVVIDGNQMMVRCPRYLARQLTRLIDPP